MPWWILFGGHPKASEVMAGASVDLDAHNALPERTETAEGLEYSSRWVAILATF